MLAEDTVRTRLLIVHSILGQCNSEKIEGQDAYWARFKELYASRVSVTEAETIVEQVKAVYLAPMGE